MKNSIFSLMIGAIVALTSCSKSDELPTSQQEGDQLTTFTVEVPALTRATVNGLTRFIVEAYEGKDITATALRTESASGTLELTLKKNTDYTFVFWADKGIAKSEGVASSGYWNTDDLKAVVVSDSKKNYVGETAYGLAVSFNSKDFEANKTVTLKNVTTQVNFIESDGLTTSGNTLKVTYTKGAKLNVATGKVTDVASEMVHTFTGIAQTAKDEILATDYVLSPLAEQNVVNLKVQFNAEPEKAINNVPFEQNFKTCVKGEYSNMYASSFAISNMVYDYEDNLDVVFPIKVRDFYYKNGTWSSTYIGNPENPCIGIVFWIDPTDPTKGKILGLRKGAEKKWGTANTLETANGISATDNGAAGTKNLIIARKDNPVFANDYSAFNWVLKSANEDNIDGRWYVPAWDELQHLFCAYIGVEPITWESDSYKDPPSDAANKRNEFDKLLVAAGGDALTQTASSLFVWASTQVDKDRSYTMKFDSNGYKTEQSKVQTANIRVISAFNYLSTQKQRTK